MRLLEVLNALALVENKSFIFSERKKINMSIIQNGNGFDFSNSTLEDKKELIAKLINKQRQLSAFLANQYPMDLVLNSHLTFITNICSVDFGNYLVNFIPNRFLTEDEFAALFATKLDEYTGN